MVQFKCAKHDNYFLQGISCCFWAYSTETNMFSYSMNIPQSPSFSQCFSCIISVASGFNLNEFYLFFFLTPFDDLLPQGLSKSLQIWGRDVQALMWSGLPNWLGILLKWGWSHLSPTCAHCWNGLTLLQTLVPQSLTLQPSFPNFMSLPLLAFVHHPEVHKKVLALKWHTHIMGTRGATVGSFAQNLLQALQIHHSSLLCTPEYSECLTSWKRLQFPQAILRNKDASYSGILQISLVLHIYCIFPKVCL